VRTGLRVAGEKTLEWWKDRLQGPGISQHAIVERDGRLTLDFEDPEGQRLSFVDDGGSGPAFSWARSSVPAEHQIRGLGPVEISIPKLERTDRILQNILGMRPAREYAGSKASLVHVYEMGAGGPAAELHVRIDSDLPFARQGAGGVHHVAFRTTVEEYSAWVNRLSEARLPSSGPVDRYYFQSLYFREPNGILIEIATDGPGFTADEPLETLGESLSLPPFLEARRREIESGLKPLC
ncbi:MAG TPA: ring-cleaving dioxygenase, partial [Terrimicrobiaceae bacterium]